MMAEGGKERGKAQPILYSTWQRGHHRSAVIMGRTPTRREEKVCHLFASVDG